MSKPAAPAAPSKDSEPILGIKVSWEIKLLCIVTVFSVLKALKAITSHFLFLLFGRLFFIAGHAYFIYVFFFTNYRITKSTSRTTEEKNVARTQCQGVMKGMLLRGVLILLVHFRTGMLPPLFVTVIMGFLGMIENDYFYQVMYAKAPQFFELCFTS
eukprot:gene32935-39831_t